jgi:hypothetical protein
MRRMGWIEWIWIQILVPLATGVMAVGVLGIPFSLNWIAMTHARVIILFVLGGTYAIFCFYGVRKRLARNGVLPPYA